MICSKIPDKKRRESLACSQKATKIAKINSLTPIRSQKNMKDCLGTVGSESVNDIIQKRGELKVEDRKLKIIKPVKSQSKKIVSFGTL